MSGITGLSNSLSSISNTYSATTASLQQNDIADFQQLLESAENSSNDANKTTLSTAAINTTGTINGDYTTGFAGTFTNESDKTAKPSGFAANNSNLSNKDVTIDKTSTLYEKSMEMENYLVKMMLSSMRKTLSTTNINGEDKSTAQNMYEDMLYDQLSIDMTKQANLGLADQIYLELL